MSVAAFALAPAFNSAANLSAEGSANAPLAAPPAGPIKDAQGRVRYIVDLVDDLAEKPNKFDNAQSKIAWHKTNSEKLIEAVVKLRGIELLGTTSLVGTSLVAYLSDNQVDQLAKDKRVAMLTEDRYVEPSGLWNSTMDPSGQVRPWGLQAMGIGGGSSNGSATVYILDTGVEMHVDLPGLSATNRLSAVPGINPTGDYPHATHVAGIVGAADNGFGVVGVLPGVRLVSISVNTANVGSLSTSPATSAIILGLEIIYQRVLQSNRTAIVNLSFNGPGNLYASTTTVGLKMKKVATPSYLDYGYRGALIVQSAGNNAGDACNYSYHVNNAAQLEDGILVVGGLDDNGQAVVRLNGIKGYARQGEELRPGNDESGTNDGACVDLWAPSQRVYSTWGGNTYSTQSGTSMAAPHISGFAAWLLEQDPYAFTTSTDLEAAVRARLTTIAGSARAMPRLTSEAVTAHPTIEIQESQYHRISLTQSESAYFPSAPTQGGFSLFPDQLTLRYQAVGAQACAVYGWRNGSYYTVYAAPTSGTIQTADLPGGQYVWNIRCTSLPSFQGTSTTVAAYGTVKRRMTVGWQAKTTSTNNAWTVVAATNYQAKTTLNGGLVQWSYWAPFDQISYSQNADRCHIQSIGYVGNPFLDPEHPTFTANSFNPLNTGSYAEINSWPNPPLWDSGPYFPTTYTFATFNFQDPHLSPYLLPYTDGYKWRLTCFNDEDLQQTAVMYGRLSP